MEEKDVDTQYDVIVIGGGPAGMMAAGRAGEVLKKSGKRGHVLLLEKNHHTGKKLLITGGGRCNVTNNERNTRILLDKFKGKGKFLFSAFSQFDVTATLDFFHKRGMATKLEAEGRLFPKTERAGSVLEVLRAYMKENKVEICVAQNVTGFETRGGKITGVKLEGGGTLTAKSYILATGGTSRPETGSTGDGFRWCDALSLAVRKPDPALVPIATKESWSHKIAGVSFAKARVTTFQNNVQQETRVGKILFTHVGLSGPLILNMSKDIGELLKYGDVTLSIDLFPDEDHKVLDQRVQAVFAKAQNKMLKNVLSEIVPGALVSQLLAHQQLLGDKEINKVSRVERIGLVKYMKGIILTPTGVLGVHKAVVVSGGVALTEIDFRTMATKKYPELFLTGDILDIDRPSGGYSLQLCWTTGWVAGTHAGESCRPPLDG